MATPLIHELRANFPDAALDVLVRWPGARDILKGNPHVSEVHQNSMMPAALRGALDFLGQLRARRYDFSINTYPQSRVHYRLVAAYVGARERISHEYDRPTWIDRKLITKSRAQDYTRHCIENNLDLLQLAGAKRLLPSHEYELFLSDEERAVAPDYLRANNLENRLRIGFHIGTGSTKNLKLRRWPLENYIKLFRELSKALPQSSILLFGGPDEQEEHARVLAELKGLPIFVPKTRSFRESAAVVQTCAIFLSVDTALMHTAAAVHVPQQLVIETPTLNPTVYPYRKDFRIIPNPAVGGRALEFYRYDGGDIKGTAEELERCMKSVTVEMVTAAIIESSKLV